MTDSRGGGSQATSTIELGIDGLNDPILIGQGGFGAVYRAEQPALGRTVAVKILSAPGLDERTRTRFERECIAVGALSGHPHIVTVYDSGINSWSRPFIVMDFMSRGSIADRVGIDGPVPWPEAVDMGVKLCGALATAHAAGILHRDVKPQNVLVSAYGEPKLGDFGISSIGGEQTNSGTVTASLEHAAPELLNGSPATIASDVYALTSTLFTMIAGESPFARKPDEPIQSLIARILNERVPDLRPRGVPGALCDVLEKGLRKDPTDRYASSSELAVALREVQEQQGLTPTPIIEMETVGGFEILDRFAPGTARDTAPTRTRVRDRYVPPVVTPPPVPVWKRPLFIGAAAVLVVAIAATSFAVTRPDDPPPSAPTSAKDASDDGTVASRDGTDREDPSKTGKKANTKKNDRPRNKQGTSGVASFGSGTSGGSSVPSAGSAPGSGTASSGTGSGGGGSNGGTSGGGGSNEQPPPAPPAPDTKLYHAYKGRDHIMYTDPGLTTTYYNQGYDIETLGGVYSYQEDGTRSISAAGKTLWVFASGSGQTSPQTERRPIWYMSSGTDDDFYTADEGLTTYYYSRGWAQRQQVGWVAS